jgi:hypothetical protein
VKRLAFYAAVALLGPVYFAIGVVDGVRKAMTNRWNI